MLVNQEKAEQYYELACKAHKSEAYNEMVNALNKSIELKPEEAKFYFSKGIAYHELGKHGQAIENYDKAILLDEKYPNAYSYSNRAKVYFNQGNAYSKLGKHEQAIENYDKAILLDEKYPNTYSNRGNAYNKLSNYEFEKAQKASSKHEYEQAIENYDRAILLGDKEIKDYSKAVELNLNNKLFLKRLKITVKIQELKIRMRENMKKRIELEKQKK